MPELTTCIPDCFRRWPVLLTVFLWYGILPLRAQTTLQPPRSGEIEIHHANEMEIIDDAHEKMKKLTGDVVLQQNNVILMSDQVNLYDEENRAIANGHVKIIQDTVVITADHLNYDGHKRKAVLNGHVVLTNRKMTLSTSELEYDLNTRTGTYTKHAVVRTDSSVLTSMRGRYFANTNDVLFSDSVHITDPRYTLAADSLRFNTDNKTSYFLGPTHIFTDSARIYCERGYYDTEHNRSLFTQHAQVKNGGQWLQADSLLYNMKTGAGEGFNQVRFSDSAEQVLLLGGYARYNQHTRSVYANRHPVLINVIDHDSLFLTGEELYSDYDTLRQVRSFRAFHKVRVYKSDMQALTDSLSFSYADSTFRLFGHPVLWVDSNQLRGDTINIRMSRNQLSKIYLRRAAFVVNAADTGRFNQIQGKNMTGLFHNGKMTELDVDGNGESIYFARQDSGGYLGMNKALCSNMIIFVQDNKLDHILFLTKPEATLYPLSQVPAGEDRLKNFTWLFGQRPKSKNEILR